ncbi:hypothetical protein VHARVF571_600105 [Vibrio harveyi]|nr:hypothetical protein VHARVF571_600105 [Vibrio harveyi]
MTRSRRANCLGFHTLLTIFDLEPLDLQIVAASANQVTFAEPRISRLLGYTSTYHYIYSLLPVINFYEIKRIIKAQRDFAVHPERPAG